MRTRGTNRILVQLQDARALYMHLAELLSYPPFTALTIDPRSHHFLEAYKDFLLISYCSVPQCPLKC